MPRTNIAGSRLDQPAGAVVRRVAEDELHLVREAIVAHRRAARRALRKDSPKRRKRAARALHDLRIALRHMMAWFEVAAPVIGKPLAKRDRRPWRRLARRAGEVRDLHVLTAWLDVIDATTATGKAAARFAEAHRALLARADRRLERQHDAIASDDVRALLRWTRRSRGAARRGEEPFAAAMADALRAREDEIAAAIAAWTRDDSDQHAHALRLAVKRMRYLLSHLAADCPDAEAPEQAFADAQDALGRLHDAYGRLVHLSGAREPLLTQRARRALAATARTAARQASARALVAPRTAARRLAASLGARGRSRGGA